MAALEWIAKFLGSLVKIVAAIAAFAVTVAFVVLLCKRLETGLLTQ